MDPNRVIDTARALVHLWQTEAKTALIALDTWPELGEAIDELAESFAPEPRHPGAAVPVRELLAGDVIRYSSGPFEAGLDWTVVESVPDVSRREPSWRLVTNRFESGQWNQRAGDYSPEDKVTLLSPSTAE